MKRSFAAIIMLLLIPALMTSCWKTDEDWSLCGVDNNFTLKFRVQDGTDLTFQNNINSVDAFLFDADKNYIDHKQVNKSELNIFKGVTFTVTPGVYHVVCWANVGDHSRLSAMTENSNFEHSFIEIASTLTGDPIYYAPYKTPVTRSGENGFTRADDDYTIYSAEVLPNTKTVKELTFSLVHRTVQVFISGYESTSLFDGVAPNVEFVNTYGKYNFLLQADLTPLTLVNSSKWTTTQGGDMYYVDFYSALVPVQSDMVVNLYHPTDHSLLASVNLEAYIAQNNIADDSVVPIMFKFSKSGEDEKDVNVSVTMPSWMNNNIEIGD